MTLHTTHVPVRAGTGFDPTYLLSVRNAISREDYANIINKLNELGRPHIQRCNKALALIFIPLTYLLLSFIAVSVDADATDDEAAFFILSGFVAFGVGSILFAIKHARQMKKSRDSIHQFLDECNKKYEGNGLQFRLLDPVTIRPVSHPSAGTHHVGARGNQLLVEVTVDLQAGVGEPARTHVNSTYAPPPYGIDMEGKEAGESTALLVVDA
eukprot:comp16999_c1_seq1/m.15670 comp16999_c1_seq1/g.15670  ORF comp16999_c1_seq1/g.15670 comp16999_c1_seq1/m.15670 type:complete len:212 (-) comp16999_c1_seq1:201-836(-)